MSNYNSTFLKVGEIDNDGDPDIVYYNCDIINDTPLPPNSLGDANIIKFIETRSVPILNNTSKFQFSIIRFTMNGPNKDLPILIPNVIIGQSNIDLTVYSITINMQKTFVDGSGNTQNFNGSSTKPIIYKSETTAFYNNNLALPLPPLETQDVRGIYYWVYTYDHFCDLVNTTFSTIYADLKNQYVAYQATFPSPCTNQTIISQPPNLVYDENSGLFSIYYDVYGWGNDSTTNNSIGTTEPEIFNMFFNDDLFNLLDNFNNFYCGSSVNIPNGNVNQLLVVNKSWTNYIPPVANPPPKIIPQPSEYGYWKMTQNYNSTSSLWSPIGSIVFTSSLLPIVSEQVGQPNVYGEGNDLGTTSSSSAFQPIITDIALPLNNAHDYRDFIEYAPSAEYRMSAFTKSKQSLSNIDIQVYWKNRLNNTLYPVRMTNFSTVSLKIMFRKIK